MDTQTPGQQAAVPVFQNQKPLQPDMGHNSLANFQIEKKIGRGQFSEVYRARYLLDNTSVALKKVQVQTHSSCLSGRERGRRTDDSGGGNLSVDKSATCVI
uniref:NIMA-related kinase 7 n=1 Tax=Knipowitschia caucasica TaxID=637954 RepID=A0AAV2KNS1_KNICA